MTRRRLKAMALGACTAATLAVAGNASAAGEADRAETTTPIKHFVVLMQENHTFDNYFGTYPGADGIPEGTCMPRNPKKPKKGCVEPFAIGRRAVSDLEHRSATHDDQFRGGAMDGFVWALRSAGEDAETTMGYYDDKDIPYYWNIADEYVLFDRFFSSASGGSVENHMFSVTGAPGRKANESSSIPEEGWGDIPTIFDRLEAAGISWKFYIQNYNPRITFASPDIGDRGARSSGPRCSPTHASSTILTSSRRSSICPSTSRTSPTTRSRRSRSSAPRARASTRREASRLASASFAR